MPNSETFQFNGMELTERELLILLINKLNDMDQRSLLREKTLKVTEDEVNTRIKELTILIGNTSEAMKDRYNVLANKQEIQEAIILQNDKKNSKLIAWLAIILTILQFGSTILLSLLKK